MKPNSDDACPIGKGTRARTLLKVIAAFAFVFFAAANTLAQPQNFGMQMHVINIGQGEAILLEFQNHAVLVDTGAEVRFLSGRRYCNNENNDSLVMRVQFGQKSFLLVGDWETEDEAPNNCGGLIRYLTNKFKNKDDLDVDVYKVGHHGSYNGTNDAILAKMTPDYAVISAGKFEDKTPGGFHAFQFAHPRGHPGDNTTRDSLLKIIAATKKTRPATEAYYLDKVPKKKKIKGVMKTVSVTKRTDFTLTKAVYCTCWDDNIIFTVNTAGDDISVGTKPSD
ncbi:MAG: ComEC/Rec2 family competence protein [Pyrinomonadaceae bacterium]